MNVHYHKVSEAVSSDEKNTMKNTIFALFLLLVLAFYFVTRQQFYAPLELKLTELASAAIAADPGAKAFDAGEVAIRFDHLDGTLTGKVMDQDAAERLVALTQDALPVGRIIDELSYPSKSQSQKQPPSSTETKSTTGTAPA